MMHGQLKVAGYVAKAVIAEVRGVDLSDAHERMASFHGFQDCFAYFWAHLFCHRAGETFVGAYGEAQMPMRPRVRCCLAA
jgi:hypothetical protein